MALKTTRADELGPMFDGTPRLLGYASVAAMTPRRTNDGAIAAFDSNGHAVPVLPTTIRSYYYTCLKNGQWFLLPKPDAVLLREDGSPLPGWTEETVLDWLGSRPGAGNKEWRAQIGDQRSVEAGM